MIVHEFAVNNVLGASAATEEQHEIDEQPDAEADRAEQRQEGHEGGYTRAAAPADAGPAGQAEGIVAAQPTGAW